MDLQKQTPRRSCVKPVLLGVFMGLLIWDLFAHYDTFSSSSSSRSGGSGGAEKSFPMRTPTPTSSRLSAETMSCSCPPKVAAAAPTPTPAPMMDDSDLLNCSGKLMPLPPNRRRLWLCPLKRGFEPKEKRLLGELIDDGTFVPATQSPDLPPPNRTMRALYDGLWVPAPEPLLKPVGEKEIDLIAKEAKCLHRNFSGNSNDPKDLRVEACLIVRNRVKLLVEWIQYHRILGVEFFHIFDDHSHDGLQEALAPFVKKGLVKLEQVPPPPIRFLGVKPEPPMRQYAALSACIEYARERQAKEPNKGHIWQLMVDSDEFLLYDGCVGDLIHSAMDRAGGPEKVGGVAVGYAWQGHAREHKDTFRTQFERVRYRLGRLDVQFKSIVRTDIILPFGPGQIETRATPHGFNFPPPAETYFQSGKPTGRHLTNPALKNYVKGDALLLHFFARSLTSFLQRFIDGIANDVMRPTEHLRLDMIESWWAREEIKPVPEVAGISWSKFQQLHRLLLRGLGHSSIGATATDEEKKQTFPIDNGTIAAWTMEAVPREQWPSFVSV